MAKVHVTPPFSPNGQETKPIQRQTSWITLVPTEQWTVYCRAIEAVRAAGIRFMIGGAFGLACYIGRWRNTKDLDLYVLPSDRDAAVAALTKAGFSDFYDQLNYDRRWIYRSEKDGIIVDVIFAMANLRTSVEEDWFEYAISVMLKDEELAPLPPEELLWCKLYVLQRDRCDWPDVMNLLYAVGPQLDWPRLLRRVADDKPLLAGLMSVFRWISPEKAELLPQWVWNNVCEPADEPVDDATLRRRIALLDARPWFAAHQPTDEPLRL